MRPDCIQGLYSLWDWSCRKTGHIYWQKKVRHLSKSKQTFSGSKPLGRACHMWRQIYRLSLGKPYICDSQTSKRNRPLIGHGWWAGRGRGRGLGNGNESGGKSIHWPYIQRQSLFYGGWHVSVNKHRDHSIHIERECCLGPALADIWLLLR